MAVPRRESDVSRLWFANRFSGDDDDDDDYSPEPFVGVGSAFFAVNGVLPWGP